MSVTPRRHFAASKERSHNTQQATHSGAKFIDHVGHVELGMEFEVPRPVRPPRAQPARKGVELLRDLPALVVVEEFPDQILPQIGHVGHASLEGIQHQGV